MQNRPATSTCKTLGHRQGGLLDSTYDLHSNRYLDLADQVVIHHVRAIHQLVQTWPTEQMSYLEQAWSQTHQQLQAKAHPWYIVKGPMAAAIAYLQEWQWPVQELFHWTRPETPYLDANTLTLRDPWWKLEQALLLEAKNQQTSRLASRPNHQHLLTGLDWHTYRQVSKQLPNRQRQHLATWVQGAVQHREASKPKTRPICQVPATPKQIIWMCKWHKQQDHEPMRAAWMPRINCPEEEPRGVQAGYPCMEPQDLRQQVHPLQGHGTWQTLQPVGAHPHQAPSTPRPAPTTPAASYGRSAFARAP